MAERIRPIEQMLELSEEEAMSPEHLDSQVQRAQEQLQQLRRQAEMIEFLKSRRLITIPSHVGPFLIRQLPEAFKPTSPGGFMNPPGVYDKDPSGFYFIPTYNPQSRNFYIRAAIEDPRPILGH